MNNKYYHIEDVSTRTGLTKRALRYYEDIELIKPIRTETSYRLYTEEDIATILRIKELKDSLGFSLNEVKVVFNLELALKSIFRGETEDVSLIEKSKDLIKHQIQLIEEKERSFKNAKAKYEEILSKLEAFNGSK